MIQPGEIVNGSDAIRKAFADWPANQKLVWSPDDGYAARSGDLAVTTGPYQQKVDGVTRGTGRYVTVWRKNAAGEWKGLMDLGVPDPGAAVPPADTIRRRARADPPRRIDQRHELSRSTDPHESVLRQRRRSLDHPVEEGRRHRLWQPGPRPRAEPARERREGTRRRPAGRFAVQAQGDAGKASKSSRPPRRRNGPT